MPDYNFGELVSERSLRWALAAMVILVSLGLATYITLRVQVVAQLESEVIWLRAEIIELQQQHTHMLAAEQARVAALEQVVFGALEPAVALPATKAPPVLSAPAKWQVQRDLEIQNRLRALEQWRLRHEGPP